jgi:hypothetical protein
MKDNVAVWLVAEQEEGRLGCHPAWLVLRYALSCLAWGIDQFPSLSLTPQILPFALSFVPLSPVSQPGHQRPLTNEVARHQLTWSSWMKAASRRQVDRKNSGGH